jgi:hypothetical protein
MILQQERVPEFLRTRWGMEADELWPPGDFDFARVSFRATDKGWSATRGWTHRRLRNHCAKNIVRMLEVAVG